MRKLQASRPHLVVLAVAMLALVADALAAEPAEIALSHLRGDASTRGFSSNDVAELVVTDVVPSTHSGTTHVYVQQRFAGLDVIGATAGVHVRADGSVAGATSALVPALSGRISGIRPGIQVATALVAAASEVGLSASGASVLSVEDGGEQRTILAAPAVSPGDVSARLALDQSGSTIRLVWVVEMDASASGHYWRVHVDAANGDVLVVHDLVVHDNFDTTPKPGSEADTDAQSGAAHSESIAGDSYRVFPIPVESPDHGAMGLVEDPAAANASPFGWHDTDGATGAEFTDTRGNNVFAQEDGDANNTGGSRPDGGPLLDFDFAFDPSLSPTGGTNQEAAIVNLFYWNNIIHDVLYQYGFDEAAGNFQQNNYGNGGSAGDPVQADAQDGSGINNASFLTRPDGIDPRMQMFIWTSPFSNVVHVNSPPPIAGDIGASSAEFGPDFPPAGITGDVVLADDGTGITSDGCQPLVNGPLAGAIALIDRGDCTFVVKVKNAQNAGASAVLIANNVPDGSINLGGSDPTIVIPSGMITLGDGNRIKGELPGVEVTVEPEDGSVPDRDSDLDNGIIIHEYVHGLSNRLTGGPANTFCLANQEQMGEGWSDWYALALTALPGHGAATRRGVGTYVSFQTTDGAGIRPAPYSTDVAVNDYTYVNRADANISIPHGVGFIWATMLWEMYWELVAKHGFNPDIYASWNTGGNNLAIQLVTDGLKLQPCSPGFVDGRDALLLADEELTGGDNQCEIWSAFARRGLGASASQGSSFSRTDGSAAFDLPPQCGSNPRVLNLNSLVWSSEGIEFSNLDLFDDGTFSDQLDQTGIWAGDPDTQLYLLYDAGVACQGLYLGTLNPAGYYGGLRICLDGVGPSGLWFAVVQ